VTGAVEAGNAAILKVLLGDLHQADVGNVLEALDPELRPRLIELMGGDFDFAALTEVDDTVREEILDELPAATVAEGVREMDSDDAVYILEDLPKEEQAEILQQLPAPERKPTIPFCVHDRRKRKRRRTFQNIPVLLKPFTVEELRRALERLLPN
jgi:magnesium transporter